MNRNLFRFANLAVAVAGFVILPGCGGGESPENQKTPVQSGHFEGDGHDHGGEKAAHFEGDGHDHSEAAASAHPTEGPHGGHLIELGNEEYHAELLHDDGTNTVTVHLLDAAGTRPVAIPQAEIVLQLFQDGQFAKYILTGASQPEDSAGTASEFRIVDAKLCDGLAHAEKVSGRLQVTINGKPYTGTIDHSGHDDHDHEGHNHAADEH